MGRERNQCSEYIARNAGKQEGRDAEQLQHEIGDQGADHADPVVRRASGDGLAAVFSEGSSGEYETSGEDKEDREDKNQEADQLVEPPVGRRSKWTSKIHFGVRSFRGSALARLMLLPWVLREQTPAVTRSSTKRVVLKSDRCGFAVTPEHSDYPKSKSRVGEKSSGKELAK